MVGINGLRLNVGVHMLTNGKYLPPDIFCADDVTKLLVFFFPIYEVNILHM